MTIALDREPTATMSSKDIHLFGPRYERSPGMSDMINTRIQHSLMMLDLAEIQTTEEWIEAISDHLSELSMLQRGWDDESGLPIDPSLIETVFKFVSSDLVRDLKFKPEIVPTIDGGLTMEWHTDAVDLIIEPSTESEASLYYRDSESNEEVEAPLSDCFDVLGRAIVKLGYRR